MRAEPADPGDDEGACAAPADHDTPLHLWPENWAVWCLWRDVETQWRTGGMGASTGLDYDSVRGLIADRFRRRHRKTVFYLVQGMEQATLDEWRLRDKLKAQK